MSNSFDAIRFVRDHSIPTADHDSKHFHQDWINVECPFCTGNPGFHLGFNGVWNCYRCGRHSLTEVIATLLKVSPKEAREIAKTYGARPQTKEQYAETNHPLTLSLPYGITEMQEAHRYYLKKRGFDPDLLESLWHLKGTGILGPYKFRVIAPIFYKERMVSYQGRDITDRSPLKYKACAAKDEVIPHRHLLYGMDKAQGHSVIVVEGITDVWKLGPGAVATFGIEWSPEQALLLKEYSRVFVMYDFGEEQAEKQAHELGVTLSGLGVSVEKLYVPGHKGDPADLSDKKASSLMSQVMG